MLPDRLKWAVDPDVERGFIAYPEGDGTAPFARIDHSSTRISLSSWHWWVSWPGRFHAAGQRSTKQAAADKATEAWWEEMARTSDWSLPAEPLIPATIGTLPRLTDDELTALIERYHRAIAFGNVPSVEADRTRDQLVYSAAWEERRRRGWQPKPQRL